MCNDTSKNTISYLLLLHCLFGFQEYFLYVLASLLAPPLDCENKNLSQITVNHSLLSVNWKSSIDNRSLLCHRTIALLLFLLPSFLRSEALLYAIVLYCGTVAYISELYAL